MRMVVLGLAAALALGCTPAQEQEEGALAAGCDARAAYAWAAGAQTLSVEAVSFGPDCARAVATLVMRDASGDPLFIDSYLARHVMVLAGAEGQAAMQTALGEWLDASNPAMPTSAALPDWPANAQAPVSGEFPFYPSEGLDRAGYIALRAANAPLYCFVQGMESLRCVAYEGEGVTDVGVQLFPG